MSEFRQDPTTREWVIVAPERGRRPNLVNHGRKQKRPADPVSSCPFCPGNEELTPEVILQVPATAGWRVRVVPNKYAALAPLGSLKQRKENGLFVAMDGVGLHEVIIETPDHQRQIADMEPGEVSEVLGVYRDRYNTIRKDSRVKLVLIFKNQGELAGTSLAHPHSQLIATPIVPPYIRRKLEVARDYYEQSGKCVYCDLRDAEVAISERVILQSRHFVVLQAFAPKAPFETLIMPTRHFAAFGDIKDEEIQDLASVLRDTLRALSLQAGSPDYNYVVHTAPVGEEDLGYYLCHIQIIPRTTTMAGFELGTGISITTALPEETTKLMREGLPASTRFRRGNI